MRVYLPATSRLLRQLVDEGGLAGATAAYAVTPALRESYAEGDLEELEYVASQDAAAASLRLIAADDAAARRRVVLAADVPDTAAVPDAAQGRSGVRLTVPVPRDRVAAVHVDEAATEPTVAAAVAALPAADAGEEDASFTVSEIEGHDLLWYATQEIDDLLRAIETHT